MIILPILTHHSYSFLLKLVGRMYFLRLGVKGLFVLPAPLESTPRSQVQGPHFRSALKHIHRYLVRNTWRDVWRCTNHRPWGIIKSCHCETSFPLVPLGYFNSAIHQLLASSRIFVGCSSVIFYVDLDQRPILSKQPPFMRDVFCHYADEVNLLRVNTETWT